MGTLRGYPPRTKSFRSDSIADDVVDGDGDFQGNVDFTTKGSDSIADDVVDGDASRLATVAGGGLVRFHRGRCR